MIGGDGWNRNTERDCGRKGGARHRPLGDLTIDGDVKRLFNNITSLIASENDDYHG